MADPQITPPPPSSPFDSGHVPMTEEFDRAKWTLPPIVPVLIALVAVALVVTIFVVGGNKKYAAGKILGVYTAEQADKAHVLVGVQLAVENLDNKPIWIRDIRVRVKPAGDAADKAPLEDEFAPSSDFERYFQAFPDLAAHRMAALPHDTKIMPGQKAEGMVIVGFPLSKDAFDHKQWLRVVVEPFDHQAITIQ